MRDDEKVQTEMLMKDVEVLEEQFAQMTSTGWAIPEWLVYLRSVVHRRDYCRGLTF